MSKDESGLIPIGFHGLQRIANSLKITDKLLNERKIESVIIGEQEWMKRNLNVSRFRNGDLIPEIQDEEEWERACREKRPAWCYYDNDSETRNAFGKLYNWHAVNDQRGLAPTGWRIPNQQDWDTLIELCGGREKAGGNLKSVLDPEAILPYKPMNLTNEAFPSGSPRQRFEQAKINVDAIRRHRWEQGRRKRIMETHNGNNKSGFSALLGGKIYSTYEDEDDGSAIRSYFEDIEYVGTFWCSNGNIDDRKTISIKIDSEQIIESFAVTGYGCSVRCIKEH